MKTNNNGHCIVRTLPELEQVKNQGFVYAICPKCGDGWTSLVNNAREILKKGCLVCVNDDEDLELSIEIK